MATLRRLVQASGTVWHLSMVLWMMTTLVFAAEPPAHDSADATRIEKPGSSPARRQWHYGAYFDLSYPVDFNFPDNRRWRSKVTTQRVNELTPNMVLGYVRKDADEASRWGMEFAVQGGYDVTGQVPNASLRHGQTYGDADALSHFARANVSYLAPIGTGLKLTAGLFNTLSAMSRSMPKTTSTTLAATIRTIHRISCLECLLSIRSTRR